MNDYDELMSTIGYAIVTRLGRDGNSRYAMQWINEAIIQAVVREAEFALEILDHTVGDLLVAQKARVAYLENLLKEQRRDGRCPPENDDDESELIVRPPIVAETEDPGF